MREPMDLNVRPDEALLPWVGRVRAAVVLGSGFGGLAGAVTDPQVIPYADLPSFPHPSATVAGHAGQLHLGDAGGVPVVLFQGRVHRYQGMSALDAAYPARLAAALGVETLIVTNAAGGVSPDLSPGDVVLIEDQINLTGDSPLVGWPGPPGGVPFVPMRDAYDPELRALALQVAAEQGMVLHPGVYTGLLGPAFETVAEVEAFRRLGTDVVGMSTVHEVIAARALGLRVLGFSLVSNAAAGVGLSHEEVLEAGAKAEASLSKLLLAVLARL
ncbi:MAG: purine-nucleoside phosphorylase [Coriobacteriia bacterium]|nr:purine-nucleoside phosphorylase [Coriobacteriia bacterium]